MEGLLFDVTLPRGEQVNLTVYSDLHLDAAGCAVSQLRAHMDRRAKLPNAEFVLIGDIGNWVMPRDEKRHMPSVPLAELAERDDYINATIDYHLRILKGYPWRFLGIGNHELSVLKYHGFDIASELCRRLATPERPIAYGGYSGMARWRMSSPDGRKRAAFNLLYHHGFSTGTASGVPAPAIARWALQHEEWHVCAYGHNHQLGCKGVPKIRMTERGEIESYDAVIVNTGTFHRAEKQRGTPDYSEVRGHPPVMLGAPLIKFRYDKSGGDTDTTKWSVEMGDI